MGAFCHLDQLESDYPDGLFDLFCGQGWLDFVFVVPLFGEKFGECGITDYVEAQIRVEVDELFSGDVALRGQRDQSEQLLFDGLFAFLLQFEL